ncbi:MAG TPA: endonuclease III domain-containing protein [Phycisphaerales bacterium]|nr:endonuclease III domain-containing protein [Phycisphaerales bacterium]
MSTPTVTDLYERLYARFGPQRWWPGDGRFEIIVGAILTQNTNWTNVEKAIANLRNAGVLTPKQLVALAPQRLAELIRPAGYFNIKAGRLRHFLEWLFDRFDGDVDSAGNLSTHGLRDELMAVKGIGPETADSICLYAFEKPVFVVDAYTARILGRHGMIWPQAGYEEIREYFESHLPRDVQLYNEFHALLVRLGKTYCKPRPLCSGCPLEDWPRVSPD